MTTDFEDIRSRYIDRVREDLIGPVAIDEVVTDRPSDRYLTGILFPRESRIPDEEDESLAVGDEDESFSGNPSQEQVPLTATFRPASMGISFSVSCDGNPKLRFHIKCGRYVANWKDPETGELSTEPGKRENICWVRKDFDFETDEIELERDGEGEVQLTQYGLENVHLYWRTSPVSNGVAVTSVLINDATGEKDLIANEQNTLFQTHLRVAAGDGIQLQPRKTDKSVSVDDPEDDETGRLIYRHVYEYAVGHTCAATWPEEDQVQFVESSWIPEQKVYSVSADGHSVFDAVRKHPKLKPLSAEWLSSAGKADLIEGLKLFINCFQTWKSETENQIEALPSEFQATAKRHRDLWVHAEIRMMGAIKRLEKAPDVFKSYQQANAAMQLQRRWANPDDPSRQMLTWRPFQLAFQLLVLTSLIDEEDKDRSTMDLLWFPTGGGKTEAYLALMACVFFFRRLSKKASGGGVSVIMRYTLRLLTTQQFERATRMICACEAIRRNSNGEFGDAPFSIGLWVGGSASANRIADAHNDKENGSRHIRKCPCCGDTLQCPKDSSKYAVYCENESDCSIASKSVPLPIWTVDDDVYRELPTLLIGTIDKFAQIVRNPKTGKFFGLNTPGAPPDMILQDELHLITGPLGSIAGLYETAIDELCHRAGARPKIIGSTATIKRAKQQVKALFNRDVFQFPPSGLTAEDSCFAVTDKQKPGRIYLGVSTVGRSPKFALQAVSATVLQSAMDPILSSDEEKDAYWTLVTYFNSLKELGGAHVLMIDDVPKSIAGYASRHEEEERELIEPGELSSNLRQADIPRVLKDVEQEYPSDAALDSVLATNMISVGIDIGRLGLMIVNGQPKTISEYIQATSRVGRDKAPGLVIGVFNANKARDRSHYETFTTWHSTLYRDVEATSVTPFAARSQDKALHGVLVALVRHTIAEMSEDPVLTADRRLKCAEIISAICERAIEVDHLEGTTVAQKLESLLDHWERRESMDRYWEDRQLNRRVPLMMSAETHAALKAVGRERIDIWPTLNSMRDVEPNCNFRLVEGLNFEAKSGNEDQSPQQPQEPLEDAKHGS